VSRRQRRGSIPRPQKLGWTPFALVNERPDGARQYQNGLFSVLLRERPDGWIELGIRARHGGPVRDWTSLQRVKNELVGPEREALELFPRESRLVDLCNESHLWVLPAGEQFQHGFFRRAVRGERLDKREGTRLDA